MGTQTMTRDSTFETVCSLSIVPKPLEHVEHTDLKRTKDDIGAES